MYEITFRNEGTSLSGYLISFKKKSMVFLFFIYLDQNINQGKVCEQNIFTST